MINIDNFEENQPILPIDSPTSLQAMNSLGWTFEDLQLKTRKEIIAQEKTRLNRVNPAQVNEFISLKEAHAEQQRIHRIQELSELRKKITEDKNRKQESKSSLMQTQSMQYSVFNKEEFLKKEQMKLEKMKERQKKQIEALIKGQMQAIEIKKREEEKVEKIKLLEEKKAFEMKLKYEQLEELKNNRESRLQENENAKKIEQEKLIQRFEEKQEIHKIKQEEKQRDNEERKVKNQEEREKIEQQISQRMQEQALQIKQMFKAYKKKEQENEKKRKELEEKSQERLEKKRSQSEQKKLQIQDLLIQKENEEEQRKQRLITESIEKEYKLQAIQEQEQEEWRQEGIRRQEKIERVRGQFHKSLSELNIKRMEAEEHLNFMMGRAEGNRSARQQQQSLKQFENSLKLEETLENVKRVQRASENKRKEVFMKILEGYNKIQRIRKEKSDMEAVKAKIRAKNMEEQKLIKRELSEFELGKTEPSRMEKSNQLNDSFISDERKRHSVYQASPLSSGRRLITKNPHSASAASLTLYKTQGNNNFLTAVDSQQLTQLQTKNLSNCSSMRSMNIMQQSQSISNNYYNKSVTQQDSLAGTSKLRYKLMQMSSSASNKNEKLMDSYLKKKKRDKRMDYHSNKLVRNFLTDNFLDSITTNQQATVEELHEFLSKEIIEKTQNTEGNSASKEIDIEKLAKDLKMFYNKQEQQMLRNHQLHIYHQEK